MLTFLVSLSKWLVASGYLDRFYSGSFAFSLQHFIRRLQPFCLLPLDGSGLLLLHSTRFIVFILLEIYQLTRVRTILVLGYRVLGNIHRYWVVLLLGDIFCCSDTQYNTNQRAVSTVHMPVNDYLVLLLTCSLADAIVCLDKMLICCCLLNTIIVIIKIEFWDFSWSLLCSTQVSVLVLGIGISRGQYYWVLDIGCLSWYSSNPTVNTCRSMITMSLIATQQHEI